VGRNVGLDDVVDHFTLVGDELDLLRNKAGATRLGFTVLLKFLLWRGRFPRGRHEIPDAALPEAGVAADLAAVALGRAARKIVGAELARRHAHLAGEVRDPVVADAETLVAWLAEHVAEVERGQDRVRGELLARSRSRSS